MPPLWTGRRHYESGDRVEKFTDQGAGHESTPADRKVSADGRTTLDPLFLQVCAAIGPK
jgi:hypothetical protein